MAPPKCKSSLPSKSRTEAGPSLVRAGRGLIGLLALLLFAAVLPSAASADVQTIDFESGPALETPFEGSGDISFPKEPGFRPYRREVGARAHSGTTVGDLGRCAEETGGGGQTCELFQAQTTARLARTAERVTLFAGQFGPFDPTAEPEQATLTAFSADGTQVATSGPIPIDANGFNAELSVESAAGDIASFTVRAVTLPEGGGETPAADLGIDDVTVSFAGGAKPDFAVSTTFEIVRLAQGRQVEVPVSVPRVNGSSGPVELSISGLPAGVHGAFSPNPVSGTQSTVSLTLSADPSASDTHFGAIDATIVADPLGNPDVGPAPRDTPISVQVTTNFELSVNGVSDSESGPGNRVPIEAPDCAPLEVPLKVRRDIAFDQDISLSLREDKFGKTFDLPPGVSAEILPSPIVHPGGGLVAERTLRFRADPNLHLDENSLSVLIEATSGAGPSASTRVLPMTMFRARPSATLAGPPLALTPRFGKDGTRVRLHGSGFCPGTAVNVGSDEAPLPATLLDDHTIEFNVPRYATTGPITIVPPGGTSPYRTDDKLIVDSVRNSDGFQFPNYSFGGLSLGEFTKAFGTDDVYTSVNPCWPFGDCRVTTGILDPIAAVEWGFLAGIHLTSISAHCFGMNLASQLLVSGKEPYGQFDIPDRSITHPDVFDLPGPTRPRDDLNSFLDAMQTRQNSDEYISAWLERPRPLQRQLDTLEREFSHNREPMVSIIGSEGEHSVLAYDMVKTPDGTDIYVYDNSRPFLPTEDGDGLVHKSRVESSVIKVNTVAKTWSYRSWEGGNDGIWVVPLGTTPDNPSLPGLGALRAFVSSLHLGSLDGSVRTVSDSAGAEYLPTSGGALDFAGAKGTSGTWVSRNSDQPLDVTFVGVKPGRYSQAYSSPGFAAGISDVPTEKGVRDTVEGAGDSLTFAGGSDRPLQIELAQRSSPTETVSATLDTHASADGSDTAGFSSGGSLIYTHDGSPTALSFTLTSVRRDGGPATFVSGPVAVGSGDRLSVKPVDRDLRHVLLVIHGADGKRSARVLRNRGHTHGHLELGAPKLSGHRLSVRLKLSGVHGEAIAGAALRLMRGKRLIARKALSLEDANGTHRVTWKLPGSAKRGHYRLLSDVRAVTVGARGSTATGSVSAHRAATVEISG